MNILEISVLNEDEIKVHTENFFELGIISQKAACLLNYMLQFKLEQCRLLKGYNYMPHLSFTVKGGGILVKGDATVTINYLNEVGIYFFDKRAIEKYISASEKAEIFKSIKTIMANELKKLWKSKNKQLIIDVNNYTRLLYKQNKHLSISNDIVTFKNGKKVITINSNEYYTLYEFLNGKDPEKIKKQYGITAYNTMIGNQIKDQFIFSEIDVIKNKIKNEELKYIEICKKAYAERHLCYKQLIKKQDKAYTKFYLKYKKLINKLDIEEAKAKKIKNLKINKLNAQIKKIAKL